MADEITYVPARHAVTDATSGLVSRPWLAFFQRLTGATVNLTTTVGTLLWTALPSQGASTLVGRGSASAGTPQAIALGAGLTMSGTTLSVAPAEVTVLTGRWEPLTTGIVSAPELIYALGDVVMVVTYEA